MATVAVRVGVTVAAARAAARAEARAAATRVKGKRSKRRKSHDSSRLRSCLVRGRGRVPGYVRVRVPVAV